MLPFKKKKEDEDKDLDAIVAKKPRKPRKKIEPQKPWGKIERLIVFTFLISAPIFSIIFFVRSKNSKTAKPVPVTVTAPKIISNIVVNSVPDTKELNRLLTAEIENLNGNYGIWVQALDNSYSLGINENDQFDGASLFKLPLMIGYYQSLDDGTINPETSYTLKYSDAQSGAGVLASLPAGTEVTYHDMVEDMGKNSDNTAFAIMTNILGYQTETNVIANLGMTNTDFNNNQLTAFDVGQLFFKLNNNNLISNSSKNQLYEFLTDTDFENLIPAELPENVRVVHKYGADEDMLGDAGIVFVGRPYILVILSQNSPEEQTIEIPKLSKIVYDWSTK